MAVTDHAIERYRERVKPWVSFEEAEAEVLRLLPFASLTVERPSWVHEGEEADGYAVLCDGVAFTLHRRSATVCAAATCLVRGAHSDEVAAARRRWKAMRRHDRRHNVDRHRATRRRRWEAA